MVMLKIYLNWLFCALCLQKQVYRLLTFEAMHRMIEIKHCVWLLCSCILSENAITFNVVLK